VYCGESATKSAGSARCCSGRNGPAPATAAGSALTVPP